MTTPSLPARQGGIGRFAPSPTGRLHLGHLASALLARDRAHAIGGSFLIRIEDLDRSRARDEHVVALLDDLAWAGIVSDGPVVKQSERMPLYGAALGQLRGLGLIYPCICTRSQNAGLAAPHGEGGPRYSGRCRISPPALDPGAMDFGLNHEATTDRAPGLVWRLDHRRALAHLDSGPGGVQALTFRDLSAGVVTLDARALDDVVLARKDGAPAYHLAVVVDDAAQGVSEVVRGHDLLPATSIHRLLQALLDVPTPRYIHHPLVLGADGRRLAKRDQPATLADLRAGGIKASELVAMLRQGRLPPAYRFDAPYGHSGMASASDHRHQSPI